MLCCFRLDNSTGYLPEFSFPSTCPSVFGPSQTAVHIKCAVSFNTERGSKKAGTWSGTKLDFACKIDLTHNSSGDTRNYFFEFRFNVKKTELISFGENNPSLSSLADTKLRKSHWLFCNEKTDGPESGWFKGRSSRLPLLERAAYPGAQINAKNLVQGSGTL